MTHPCNECPNFTDGKCCHETKASSQFKVGDSVVRLDIGAKHIYSIQKIEDEFITVVRQFRHKTYGTWLSSVELRHATHEEIKAGHRIDFNLNDTIATAFDDLGDDKNIENHVSPQCIVRGEK